MNNNTAFDAAGPIKPFDIVEITGNYKAHPHPQTGERMKKGHLGLVLSVDGGTMCVRPFGYPYTAEFTAEELSIKHSLGLSESEVLGAALGTSKFLLPPTRIPTTGTSFITLTTLQLSACSG